MYLATVKLARILFWGSITTGILTLLMPRQVPVMVPLVLASACATLFVYALLHVRRTRRHEWRCPTCAWVPFALDAWKCKECGFVWDSFGTDGVCPRCGHRHQETACPRCRKIAPNRRWARPE